MPSYFTPLFDPPQTPTDFRTLMLPYINFLNSETSLFLSTETFFLQLRNLRRLPGKQAGSDKEIHSAVRMACLQYLPGLCPAVAFQAG